MSKKKPTIEDAVSAAGWVVGIAGVVFFLFGLMLFLNPARTIEETVFFMGFVLFIAGILKLAEGLCYSKKHDASGFFVAMGLISLIIGLAMILQPLAVTGGVIMTFGFLTLLLALLAFVSGIAQVMFAMKCKKKTIPTIIGVFYVLLGLIMLFNPLAATFALVSVIGLFFMMYGALLIAAAFYVRGMLE